MTGIHSSLTTGICPVRVALYEWCTRWGVTFQEWLPSMHLNFGAWRGRTLCWQALLPTGTSPIGGRWWQITACTGVWWCTLQIRLGCIQVHTVHDGHWQQVGCFSVSARTPCKAFLFGKRRTGRSKGLIRQSQEGRKERGSSIKWKEKGRKKIKFSEWIWSLDLG